MEFYSLGGGVYKRKFGDSHISVLKKLNIDFQPKDDFSENGFPLREFSHERIDGKFVLSWETDFDERFYGLGVQYFKLNQRGRSRRLRINSDVRTDTGESNACCSFFVSSKGYGVVVDTARVVDVYLASTAKKSSKNKLGEKDNNSSPDFEYTPPSDLVQVTFPDGGATVYVIAGKDISDVVAKYNLMCGGFIPPVSHLGFWHRVARLYGEEDVYNEIKEFNKRDFPISVIGLEPGWQTNSYPSSLAWGERFKNPAKFTQKLGEEGLYVNNWQHFYISEKCPAYKKLEKYSSDFTVWGGLVPDVWDARVEEILKDLLKKEQVEKGVAGFKIDECDGSEHTKFSWIYPDHARFNSGLWGEEYRQTAGLVLQSLTKQIYRERNLRTFGLVRASGIGASSLPYAIYTDLYDHKEFINAMLNASCSGMIFCPEVRGVERAEELVCRFKTALFSPLMMLNAWCDKVLPWSYKEVEDIIRKIVKFRYKLIPYIYSQYHYRYKFGRPILSPMCAIKDFDANEVGKKYKQFVGFKKVHLWDVFDDELSEQYMFGDRILVVVTKVDEKEKAVYLPKGKWVDFNTGKRYDGDCFINYTINLEDLPIFIKDDCVLPLLEEDKIVARIYGNGENFAEIFIDDGISLDYERGKVKTCKLSVVNGEGKVEYFGNFEGKEKEVIWQKF